MQPSTASAPLQPYTLPVDPWIKFTATTVGRDKLYRTIQYVSKFLAYYLAQRGYDKDSIDRFTRLSNAVGMARKLFRLGKPVDFIQTILKSVVIKDDVVRMCAIGRSASLAGWLTLDAFQWLNAQGIWKVNDIQWVNKNAARCWLTGLLFAVAADLYRLRNNMQRLAILQKPYAMGKTLGAVPDEDVLKKEVATLQKEQQKIVLELVQDSLDLVIPGSILEYIQVNAGVVGLIGTITSVIGWNAAWPRS